MELNFAMELHYIPEIHCPEIRLPSGGRESVVVPLLALDDGLHGTLALGLTWSSSQKTQCLRLAKSLEAMASCKIEELL